MLAFPEHPPPGPSHHHRVNHESTPSMEQFSGAHRRQYAYPAYSENGARPQSNKNLSFSDHMLRRKTPNGLVSDAYDGRLTDRTVQLPASKHVVLSATPEKRQTYPSHWQGSGHLEQGNFGSDNISHSQSTRALRHASLNEQSTVLRCASTTPNQSWINRPAWDFPGGLDSVLNQELPFHPSQRYYVQGQYGSSVPTVRPLALPSWAASPTASASPEMYGPYWPDGSFNPYRPAPVRDSRFYDHRFEDPHRNSNMTTPVQQSEYVGRQEFDAMTSQIWPSHAKNRIPVFATVSQRSYDLIPDGRSYESEYNIRSRLSRARTFHDTPWAGLRPSEGPNANTLWQNPNQALSTGFIPNPASEQFTNRENTFTWAQSVYMQLLNNIQKAQKAKQPHTDTSGKQSRRPVIFPRPPRQVTLPFRDGFNPQTSRPPLVSRQQSYPNQWQMDSDPPRPSTAIFSPSRRPSGQNDPTGSVDPRHRLQSFSDHYNDKYRTIRQPCENAHSLDSSQGGFSLIQDDAINALDKVETLCKSSDEDWIDGMLLAGCLAYGLGEYYKAMKWYQTILSRDPRHVEAMSNLAATLLALNRREEALGHWSAAVKLRPSYFEAAEHLIGLLCHTHRTKDAVAIIQEVERALRLPTTDTAFGVHELNNESDSETRSRTSSIASMESMERAHFDYETESIGSTDHTENDIRRTGFGSSGFAIPGSENGRILALIHAKGNMLYSLGDNNGAAIAFEDAILIATGGRHQAIKGLIQRILSSYSQGQKYGYDDESEFDSQQPILLSPEKALLTAKHLFPQGGDLPGLGFISQGLPRKAAVATTSNSLLSLAKIYQDGMSNGSAIGGPKAATGTRDILALYYLSLSLQPSPSTANNVGILLASVQSNVPQRQPPDENLREIPPLPGVVPESGIQLALAYYNYGLRLDKKHAHLYTNLGSLLKDIGQLDSAIRMYEQAVQCDPKFDIALANLANAVKDRGQVADAIAYYRRAVGANPDFAEAVCGLATALNSVCGWHGRGGIYADDGKRDPLHVDENGDLFEAKLNFGWMKRVVDIVERQLADGQTWGVGCLTSSVADKLLHELSYVGFTETAGINMQRHGLMKAALQQWSGRKWEGARIVRLVERATRRIGWHWYQDRYKRRKDYKPQCYARPSLPASLTTPNAPTVLPFHTFTAPLSAKQIRQISQRNGLRISVSTLRAPWLPATVYPPPAPPRPHLNVGYVSSDFNNHPLAHLMQSVFGLHDASRVHAICYATTASDKSVHRQQIEREAPVFHNASGWSVEQLVDQIVKDNVHILINLNGYTRGARNEVFAARAAPIHMSFMGFAGTLGAEWSDYILADSVSVPLNTLSPWRRNVSVEDLLNPSAAAEDAEHWVYAENLIFTPATFFCCDHKQSAPDTNMRPPSNLSTTDREQRWEEEQARRWKLRKSLFPALADNAVVLGNFNQLYKIDPSTFRLYLRILSQVPNAVLWLLRFPDLGEQHLLNFAREWGGPDVAGRIVFTDVAPKGAHITRASVLDLFLDTPECNAHTTAADVLWSGTPVLTQGRWTYKMASRMAGSITGSALPEGIRGHVARGELVVDNEEGYLEGAVKLAGGLRYDEEGKGRGTGRLMELRRMLWEGRWTSRLFDTKRWVRDVERAYWEAWEKWERGDGGDIWL